MSSSSKDAKSNKETPAKEKKRRRTLKTDGSSASENVVVKKPRSGNSTPSSDSAKTSNQRVAFYQEENEIEKRNPQNDLELHANACEEIRRIMSDVKALKDSGKEGIAEKVEDLRVHGTLQFVTLKRLNRLGHFRCKKVRDRTNEAKQKIDQHHLKLQNLLYEVMHLQKEITKCLEFKSKDEEISLVSVDQFYKDAPAEISKPDVTKNDPHHQTLARLDWELEQRKQLAEKLKTTENSKDGLAQQISTKKEYLDSLQPKLNSILQSTKPVQEYLGMPFDEVREQHRTAAFLPRPLYVLYMQTTAFRDACDKHLTVTIQGDVDVARAMEGTSPDLDEESDSDQEQDEKPHEKRRRHNTVASDKGTQRKQKVLKNHPLAVHLQVKCKDESTLYLVFHYMVALEIVTVAVRLEPGPLALSTSISGGDLLSSETLLSCLFPGDEGNDTPNPSNCFVLRRLGLRDFNEYVKEVGHPYIWVENLCGLQFLTDPETGHHAKEKAQVSVSASHMEVTIKKLRRRVKARLSLQKQLASLEKYSIPVSSEYVGLFHTKLASRLTQWKRTTYEDYITVPSTQSVVQSGLVGESDLFFSGVMSRGSAQLHFHVVVYPDYPETAPVFSLSLQWNSQKTNDGGIQDMEAEVNIHYEELIRERSHDELLTNQLQRLLMCLDVYLETEADNSAIEGPIEFSKEKIFPRINRGPDRARPYKYDPKLGFFTQR